MSSWTIKTAEAAVGGLSNPSKMPSYGTSLPAQTCKIGSKLVAVKGSVCEGCYALKGAYAWKNTQSALRRRFDILMACELDPAAAERWIDAMSYLLNTREAKPRGGASDNGYFRWHDSGDLQGAFHLRMISEVASRTPRVKHWLPTRELPTVKAYLASHGEFPDNLVVRLSANKVGARLPDVPGTAASGVHITRGEPENGAVECGAIYQQNSCGDCRECWDPNVREISYLKH